MILSYDWEPHLSIIETAVTRRIRSITWSILEAVPEQFNLSTATVLTDQIKRHGTLAVWTVLGVIYERLFRRKGLYLGLELLEFCVQNCGLNFIKHVRKHFLQAMTRLLKLTSLREQTLAGQMSSTFKHVVNLTKKQLIQEFSPTQKEVRDVILIRCQKKILYLFQLWTEAYALYESRIPDIFKAYRKLQQKGYKFPTVDPQALYLTEDAPHGLSTYSKVNYQSNSLSSVTSNRDHQFKVSTPDSTKQFLSVQNLSTFDISDQKNLKKNIALLKDKNIEHQKKQRYIHETQMQRAQLIQYVDALIEKHQTLEGSSSSVMTDSHAKLNRLLDLLIDVDDVLDEFQSWPTDPVEKNELFTVKSPTQQSVSQTDTKVDSIKQETRTNKETPEHKQSFQKAKIILKKDSMTSSPIPLLPPPPSQPSKVISVDLLDLSSDDETNK